MTGSTFATYARAETKTLTVLSGADAVTTYERCPGNVIAFCRQCGSLVPHPPEGSPEVEFFAGLLDDDPGVSVSFHIYACSRAPWHEIDDELPRFDEQVQQALVRGELDEPVQVLDSDGLWPAWYLLDAQELRQELGERLHDIQHFGSTSVPHLPAKPIIDILVALESWPLGVSERALFEKLGYEYLGQAGVPGREYFRRRTNHATNLAVVRKASALWDDNIVVRDYLRAHPDIAATYGELKRAIWSQGARALLEYSRAKHDFVNALLTRARRWRAGT
jgi:GrpB-like predicted nucleotidyltransferase (UPF0157 family)